MSKRKPTKASRSPKPAPSGGLGVRRASSAAAMMLNTVQSGTPTAPQGKPRGVSTAPAHAAPAPAPAPARIDERVLEASAVTCAPFEPLQPQSVGISYWFDTRPEGPAYDVPVRLVGRLVDPAGLDDPRGAEAFDLVHTIRDIPAGVGRLCATIRITDTAPGRWDVTAYPPDGEPVRVEATSGFGPVIGEIAPGASLGAWAALVGAGAAAGLGLFAVLAGLAQLAVLPLMAIALVACIVGLVGAKVYYLVQSPGSPSWASPGGMCIQGFVIGALATLAAGAWLVGVPLLVVFDIAAPAILLGMAIGRLGCWKGGCCAGRLTAGRFAVWCSDRRIGGRRIPTQLMESALALLLSVVTTVLVIGSQASDGVAAVLGLSAYILVRQYLLRLRSVPRTSILRPMITMAVSGIAVAVSIALVITSIT